MSRSRHTKGCRAMGGKADLVSGNPNVVAEAGKGDGRKKGGKVLGKIEGKKAKHHMGRPGRKTGGAVGANTSPLSTAHRAVSSAKV